ncbi:MAG: VOC family protein [Myxococcota bacterium]
MSVHELFPQLRVHAAAEAITFYIQVFGAVELFRLVEPAHDGVATRVGHAELKFGTATIMISDEYPEYGIFGPKSIGGASSGLHLHVDDADATIQRAIDAGATLVRPATDQFYGERSGTVRDPYGHEWSIGHEIEKVTHEEMQRRYDAMFVKAAE